MELIFLALGYFLGTTISSNKPNLQNPDRILKWDPNVFAWRPLANRENLSPDETILFAYEMKKNSKSQNEEG